VRGCCGSPAGVSPMATTIVRNASSAAISPPGALMSAPASLATVCRTFGECNVAHKSSKIGSRWSTGSPSPSVAARASARWTIGGQVAPVGAEVQHLAYNAGEYQRDRRLDCFAAVGLRL
jgi:hypothetical protein